MGNLFGKKGTNRKGGLGLAKKFNSNIFKLGFVGHARDFAPPDKKAALTFGDTKSFKKYNLKTKK